MRGVFEGFNPPERETHARFVQTLQVKACHEKKAAGNQRPEGSYRPFAARIEPTMEQRSPNENRQVEYRHDMDEPYGDVRDRTLRLRGISGDAGDAAPT